MDKMSPWQSPATIPESVLKRMIMHCHTEAMQKTQTLCQLSHVCQYWRRVMISDVTLWTNISFENKKLAALALSRTKWDTPLDVSLCNIGPPTVDGEAYDFVKGSWFRIRSLAIGPEHPDDNLPSVLQFFVDNPPPNDTLEELFIGGDCYLLEYDTEDEEYEEEETPPPPPPDRKPVLERLAHIDTFRRVNNLALHSIEVPTWSSLYDNLVQLDLYDHKPRIPVDQVLDIFRRSPRLQDIQLDDAHDYTTPDESVESPYVDLLELQRIHIRSRAAQSTAFLLQHMHAPHVTDVFISLKSQGTKAEYSQLLAPFANTNLVLSVTEIWLRENYNDGTDIRTFSFTGPVPCEMLHIAIDRSSWEHQAYEPSFLQFFPNIRKVHMNGGATKMAKMLRVHNVEELGVDARDVGIFYELCPGGALETVRTLEFGCYGFRSYMQAGLQVLSRTKNLRVLRLFPHQYMSNDEVRSYTEFGIKHGILLHWANKDDGFCSSDSREPAPRGFRVIPFYDEKFTDENEKERNIVAGTKRSWKEEDSPIIETEKPRHKLMFHFPPSLEERDGFNSVTSSRYNRFAERINRRYHEVMGYDESDDDKGVEDGMDVDE